MASRRGREALAAMLVLLAGRHTLCPRQTPRAPGSAGTGARPGEQDSPLLTMRSNLAGMPT